MQVCYNRDIMEKAEISEKLERIINYIERGILNDPTVVLCGKGESAVEVIRQIPEEVRCLMQSVAQYGNTVQVKWVSKELLMKVYERLLCGGLLLNRVRPESMLGNETMMIDDLLSRYNVESSKPKTKEYRINNIQINISDGGENTMPARESVYEVLKDE